MLIAGLKKTSLIDYPGKIASVVFTQGCNFRCPYCHNGHIVIQKPDLISEESFFEFLEKRKGKLDAVVISGGEPTLQKDLIEFIQKIKNDDFYVKLDTNGSCPELLKNLVENRLVDYIAMDIKGPVNKYEKIVKKKVDITKIKQSVDFLKTSGIDYEFRTTVVSSLLCVNDFFEISDWLEGAKTYFIQKFVPKDSMIDPAFNCEKNLSFDNIETIVKILKEKIENVYLR